MNKPDDQLKVSIRREPFLPFDGSVMTDPFDKFVDEAAGHLVLSIGRGDFRGTLSQFLQIAHARGKLNYHNQLLKTIK